MGANLDAVRAWTDEKRSERLPKYFLTIQDGIEKSIPNLTNQVEVDDFTIVASALEECVTEDDILEEAVVSQASFDALQAEYDAYVLAHP